MLNNNNHNNHFGIAFYFAYAILNLSHHELNYPDSNTSPLSPNHYIYCQLNANIKINYSTPTCLSEQHKVLHAGSNDF